MTHDELSVYNQGVDLHEMLSIFSGENKKILDTVKCQSQLYGKNKKNIVKIYRLLYKLSEW